MLRDRLTEFSDCLLLGMLVCVASVPVVTAGPAFAAGCKVVRRWRDGDSPPMFATFRAEFVRGLRGGIPFSIGVAAVVLALSADLALLGTALPGGQVLSVVLPVLLAVSVIVSLRTCSVMASYESWLPAFRAALNLSLDVRRSALLAGAAGTAGLLVWLHPLMLFVVAGPLAMAAVGTTR